MLKNVSSVVAENLCISCGICITSCHKKSINYQKNRGLYVPVVDKETCVNCGRCLEFCPGRGCDYVQTYELLGQNLPEDLWFGNSLKIVTATSEDKDILTHSTSGGVVTSIVKNAIESQKYDCAFLVDVYNYNEAVVSRKKDSADNLLGTCKSRYIPVMHTEAVNYLLENPDEKIIFVGVSCFIQSLVKIIKNKQLNKENYLLIGLFCDKTMNYNVYEYFCKLTKNKGNLDKLYFRTKESVGWPGNIGIEFKEGKKIFMPASERMMVKDYFVPERCLYCLDKLNQFADISVGDNYTGKDNPKVGSSSVIIRTQTGADAFNEKLFRTYSSNADVVKSSQKLKQRYNNLLNQQFKESETLIKNSEFGNIIPDDNCEIEYAKKLSKLQLGRDFDFEALEKIINKKREQNKKGSFRRKIISFLSKCKKHD